MSHISRTSLMRFSALTEFNFIFSITSLISSVSLPPARSNRTAIPTLLMYSSFLFLVRSSIITLCISSAMSSVNCGLSPKRLISLSLIMLDEAKVLILFGASTPKNLAISNSPGATWPPAIPPKSKLISSERSPYTTCLGCGGLPVVISVTLIAAVRR